MDDDLDPQESFDGEESEEPEAEEVGGANEELRAEDLLDLSGAVMPGPSPATFDDFEPFATVQSESDAASPVGDGPLETFGALPNPAWTGELGGDAGPLPADEAQAVRLPFLGNPPQDATPSESAGELFPYDDLVYRPTPADREAFEGRLRIDFESSLANLHEAVVRDFLEMEPALLSLLADATERDRFEAACREASLRACDRG